MKRWLLYILPVVCAAVLVLRLLPIGGQEGPDSPESPAVVVSAAADVPAATAEPVSLSVDNMQISIPYLNSLYEVKVQKDIVYASKPNESNSTEALQLDLYQPAGDNAALRPVFIFIHGGGYSGGSKADAKEFSENLAKRGYVVLAVNYRLKKEPSIHFNVTLQDACEDIADVMGWISQNAQTYGLDTGRLFLGGDSAGGQISLNFVNDYLKRDPELVNSIAAIVDIYGGELRDSIQAGFPPVFIIHGTLDTSISYEISRDLDEVLQDHGIYHELFTLEGGGHDYKNGRFKEAIYDTAASFLWNIMNESNMAWLPEYAGTKEASGDTFRLPLPEAYRVDSAAGKLKVNLPEGWRLTGQQNDSLLIHIPEGLKNSDYYVWVILDQESGVSAGYAVNVNVIHPLEAELETYFDDADQTIKTRIVLTNQSKNTFNGSYEVDYESAGNSNGTYSTRIDGLEPGQSENLTIPELAAGMWTMRGYNFSGMLLQESAEPSRAMLSPKLPEPVQVDGNLEEWAGQPRFEVSDVRLDGWGGKQDLSAFGYTSWDAGNFYLALEVTDDTQAQTAAGDAIWNGDGLQLALGITYADGSSPREYHELGLAREDQGKLLKWRWLAPSGFDTGDSIGLQEAEAEVLAAGQRQ